MNTIYKYDVPEKDEFNLNLPVDHMILCVKLQKGRPRLWILIDTMKPTMPHRFAIYGTGHDIGSKDDKQYIGTFLVGSDSLVFHIFERMA